MPVHVPRFDEGATLPVGPEVPVGMLVLHGDVQKRWDGVAWQEVPLARDVALYATGARQVVRTWQLESAALGAVERFDGWTGEAFLTGQDDVASIAGDVVVTRGSSLSDGALSITVVDPDPLAGVNIGDPFMDGYFAGIIDTTQGNIIASDASQVGLRYALIVAPASLENTSRQWKTAQSAGPAASRTRWDGLTATQAMNSSTYPAAQWAYSRPTPADAASPWYLPAMDELEAVYRNLKATTEVNDTATFASSADSFPYAGGTVSRGYNPSSDPTGSAYTSSVPGQTTVPAFVDGGGQDLGNAGTEVFYWSSTEYNAGFTWAQYFSGSWAGGQSGSNKTSVNSVRPVRRLVL